MRVSLLRDKFQCFFGRLTCKTEVTTFADGTFHGNDVEVIQIFEVNNTEAAVAKTVFFWPQGEITS